jgi:uncharacterized protein YdhG (YjbR/CyaY superfamily)
VTSKGSSKRSSTIAEYIAAAPRAGQPHLRALHTLLAKVAPDAEQGIKWGTPFFVEPRFLFAFAAHKAHASFAPCAAALVEFRDELASYRTTKNTLVLPYDEPLPADLVRRIATFCVQHVRARTDDSFW